MFWVLLVLCAVVVIGASQADKLKIDVFIESQCKYSRKFLQDQVKPNYEQIKNDVVIAFIPFGKSRSFTNDSGTFFECQHGSFECECNMFQACAQHLIGDDMDRRTQFMVCSMEEHASLYFCSSQVGLHPRNVNECVASSEGTRLQLDNEKLTAPIIRQSHHVPTIVFDQTWNDSDNLRSLADFLAVVLERLNKS
jgi:hypothetical protein